MNIFECASEYDFCAHLCTFPLSRYLGVVAGLPGVGMVTFSINQFILLNLESHSK